MYHVNGEAQENLAERAVRSDSTPPCSAGMLKKHSIVVDDEKM